MTKKHKCTIFMIILVFLILFINIPFVSAEKNNLHLEFFYTLGCTPCDNKKPIIDALEQNYLNITFSRHRVLDDQNLDNYTLFKYFYGFDTVPAVVIRNNSYTFTSFPEDDMIFYENLEATIQQYYSGERPSLQNVNTQRIYLDYYYNKMDESSIAIKENILEKIDSISENPNLFFRYKPIDEYNWDYQNYVDKYSDVYPFLVINDMINESILTQNQISKDEIKLVLKQDFDVALDEKTNDNENGKVNGTPGFEIINMLAVLAVFYIVYRRKK